MKKYNGLFIFIIFFIVIFTTSGNSKHEVFFNEKVIFENISVEQLLTSNNSNNNNNTDEVLVQLKLDYEYNNNIDYSNNFTTNEEVEQFKTNLRTNGANYHQVRNNQYIANMGIADYDDLYISKYSPFVEFKTSYEELSSNNFNLVTQLQENNNIELIYISEEVKEKYEPQLSTSLNAIDASTFINSSILTGLGIKVGVLESGIINKNHEALADTTTIVRNEWYYVETVTEHSTIMAAIIAGTDGVARDATILSVELSGSASSEIDWLLDNGVDIINMSYGERNPTGVYSAVSAYADYISYTYRVTMVAASGNMGSTTDHVGNPGLGYNVITAGACGNHDGLIGSGIADFTSTTVVDGPDKPTLSAPGMSLYMSGFGGLQSGTSISSAITSGAIALLMERYPALKIQPERVISLFAATSVTLEGYNQYSEGLNQYAGAGRINVNNAVYWFEHSYYYTIQGEAKTTAYTRGVHLEAGQSVKVALAWLARANGNAGSTVFTDYDLRIYESSTNNIVRCSTSLHNNLEFVDFTSKNGGYYRLEAYQFGDRVVTGVEGLSLSYYIY